MDHCPYNTDCSGCVSYGDTLLDVSHVSLSYGDKLILRDVDVQIAKVKRRCHIQGQVVGFLAPSGTGKTQLFRIISGLNQPTGGGVFVNSHHDPVKAGMVGMVSQGYTLFEHRTVYGNLMLAAAKKYPDKAQATAAIEAILRQFELHDKLRAHPANLSGGQRQRIAIAQQLLCSEHFLLMDEPTASLDLVRKEEVGKMIVDISCLDDLNTVIVCSHDVSWLCSIADHLWLMGHERDAEGHKIPGARFIAFYDLVELGLCWQESILTRPDFIDFVRQVAEKFRTL
jgi:polar amino acid transport system ATP-binding protein/sulfate transport system ATP-binding protein